jgi:hypothetical protein
MTEQIEAAPVSTARHALRPAVPARPASPTERAVDPTVDPAVDPTAGRRVDPTSLRAERERLRRARAAYEAKISRLRLYSYCLTLGACVLALMSFMYLTQGTADGDPTFTWLGVAFVAATAVALWSAVAITRLGEIST